MRDTIAAIASGMTASGIGIIRISGPEAFRVLQGMFRGEKTADPKIENWKTHTIHYGHICDKKSAKNLDECLILAMRAPHTYTGEDTIEIDCHGGPFVMRKILALTLDQGARLAEPGEFTKRAYLNGRVDLSEAEAVMDVIRSESDDALESSLMQLGGSVKREITTLREMIINELAFIEAALDDPEHMSLDGYPDRLKRHLVPVMQRLGQLIDSFQEGKVIREGIRTVILGKPNAGKSSLLNALTGTDRAIVTDIAGTTRDVLEETVSLDGVILRVEDTAGIRETGDQIEKIGVARAKDSAASADLILCVLDAARPLDENDHEILDMICGRKAIVVLNKSDLPPVLLAERIKKETGCSVISVSAKEKTGIRELGEAIRGMFFSGSVSFHEQTMITNVRHRDAAARALDSLRLVVQSIEDGMPEDFYSIDLMDAYKSLGEIIGEAVDDDLVNTIFSKFCMGK